MARRRRRATSWTGEERDPKLNGVFEAMRDAGQAALGNTVSIGTEANANLVGLPLPALSLRYLFQSTTFPLSRIIQVTGEEGSAKSTFLYELMRWHMVYGGGAMLCENENKDSPELRNSIMEHNPTWLSRMIVKPTYSLDGPDGWQNALTTFTRLFAKMADDPEGPGRTVPMCFGVDSLMATATVGELEAIEKTGFASRGFAIAALLISKYMRSMPQRLKDYPFTIVGTNHLKPSTDMRGLPTQNIPGGKAVSFMETYEITMKRSHGKFDIDRLEYGGLRLKLTAKKNSLGPGRKSITAELLWWYTDDGNGKWVQQTAWDWNTATIELLTGFENITGKKTVFQRLREITGIVVASKSGRLAYSEILGIPASDPQLYRIVAQELEKRQDILAEVYKVLGITQRAAFQPGMDYREMLERAQEEAVTTGADLYSNVEDLPAVGDALTQEGDVQPEEPEIPGKMMLATGVIMDDMFKQINAQAAELQQGERQDAFQERIVKQLLRYAGVQFNVAAAHREAKERLGDSSLNFHWMSEAYYNFPVRLLAQKLPFTHKATLADIYGQGRFKKLPWWKEYEEQVSTQGINLSTDRAALIFNLPHAKEAFLMVLHNQPTQAGVAMADAENRQDQPWPRTTFPLGQSGIVAVLESFKSFMQTVGTQWAE